MSSQETILEQVIRQAQHFVLRLRTMFVLDTMARELRDPLITCHWGTLNSPTKTSVKVSQKNSKSFLLKIITYSTSETKETKRYFIEAVKRHNFQ
jgi:hypothetical protein